jgi:hypothetical protein
MAISLNSSHPLASAVQALIAVDPTTGSLVDLKRSGVTFTLDAGVTFIDDATNGKVLRTIGTDASAANKGFSFTPAISYATQAVGFASTMFLVLAKHSGDDNGLATYKNNVPTGGNVVINYPVPSFTNSTYGRKIALSAVNTDIYNAGLTSNTSIYGDGLRHTLATTASNPGGGWASLVGKLFIDGVNTGITTTGVAGEANFGAFCKLNNSLWKGDFLYWVFFNRVLTDAEITDLHNSVGNNNAFGLVSGIPAGGSVPSGTTTVGTITTGTTTATVPFTYSGSDQTGFEYRLNGGSAVTVSGGSAATSISLTGLTSNTTYNVEVRATNVSGGGAWSASKSFTTTSSADTTNPTLTGTITVTGISSSGYTLSWSAGSDNVAVTGYEVQINSEGYVNNGAALSKVVTGRTAGATDTVYVRAFDAAGNRSTAISTTVTLSALATGTLSLTDALVNNTGSKLANATGVKVIVVRNSDWSPITTATALTTNSSAILSSITSSLIVAGTVYRLVIQLSDGGVGVSAPITAV